MITLDEAGVEESEGGIAMKLDIYIALASTTVLALFLHLITKSTITHVREAVASIDIRRSWAKVDENKTYSN